MRGSSKSSRGVWSAGGMQYHASRLQPAPQDLDTSCRFFQSHGCCLFRGIMDMKIWRTCLYACLPDPSISLRLVRYVGVLAALHLSEGRLRIECLSTMQRSPCGSRHPFPPPEFLLVPSPSVSSCYTILCQLTCLSLGVGGTRACPNM